MDENISKQHKMQVMGHSLYKFQKPPLGLKCTNAMNI